MAAKSICETCGRIFEGDETRCPDDSVALSQISDPLVGTTVGRYVLTKLLGKGAMGSVYLGLHPVIRSRMAVKVLHASADDASTEFSRFVIEAKAVNQIKHPNIIRISDLDKLPDGRPFVFMEYLEGGSLRRLMRASPTIEPARSMSIVSQALNALQAAHEAGFVHRDLKPDNIFICDDGTVKLLDFGIAKLVGGVEQAHLTQDGSVVGTPMYLSPEQARGHNDRIGPWTDLYSIGVILYEMYTGKKPFDARSVSSVLISQIQDPPIPPRKRNPAVTPEMERIILWCLEKSPERRPASARALLAAYKQAVTGGVDPVLSTLPAGAAAPAIPGAAGADLGMEATMAGVDSAGSTLLGPAMASSSGIRAPLTPMVGREMELAILRERLEWALGGACQLTLVKGEPGTGKTRLLAEVEREARRRHVRVLHGRLSDGESAFPYHGFCELVQDFYRGETASPPPGRADLSSLAADLLALFPVLSEIKALREAAVGESRLDVEAHRGADRKILFELLAKTITQLAGGEPLVLLLENLHEANVSVEALQYIVRRLGPTPTLIIAAYRGSELEKRHPVTQMIRSFEGDSRFVGLTLGPLNERDHRKLVQSLLPGMSGLTDSEHEQLYEATEGNPYFTQEMIRSLLDGGGMERDETGSWALSINTAISTIDLPATIQQAVSRRLERLDDNLRQVLLIAAVLGRTFEFEDLEALVSDADDLDDNVERLIAERILEEDARSRGDRLTFASGVVKDVLYGELSRRKRRTLHRKIAKRLEKRYSGRLERVYPQLVHHYAEGDVADKTVEFALKLARKSLDAFSPEEALRVAQTGLEFLEDEEGEDLAVAGELRLIRALADRALGHREAAMKQAQGAADALEKAGRLDLAAEAAHQAAEIAWQGRKTEAAQRWVEKGIQLARAAARPETLGPLLSLGATAANLRGDYQLARTYHQEAATLAEVERKASADHVAAVVGGTLVTALTNPLASLDPARAESQEDVEVLGNVFEPLVAADAAGNLSPLLCSGWEASADGTSFLFTLRPDVRFSDGSAVRAADVKMSLEGAARRRPGQLAPALSAIIGMTALSQGESQAVSGIEVLAEDRLRFQLTDPLPIFPVLLNQLSTAITKVDDDGERLIGTGPFIVTTEERGRVALGRNPNYWGVTSARLDGIEFLTEIDASSIANKLRGGEIDVGRDLLPNDLEEILRDPRFRGGLVDETKKNTYFILFNQSGPSSQHPELRRALCGVIRAHDLVWQTLGRFAQPSYSLIPPGILGHDPGRRPHHESIEEAKERIEGAGLKRPIRLRAVVHPLLQDRYATLTRAILDVWAQLGVEVILEGASIEAFIQGMQDSDGIDAIIGRWIADYDDPDTFTTSLFHSERGLLRSYFCSPETDELFRDARRARKPGSRLSHYRRFEQRLAETAMLLPLFHDVDYRIASPNVVGLTLLNTPPFVNYPEVGKLERAPAPRAALEQTGTLQAALTEPVADVDPLSCWNVWTTEVASPIFETLTRADQGAGVVPWLASEVVPQDGGRRYLFRLRPDVRFHDGRRVTTRDVRFSFERALRSPVRDVHVPMLPIRGAKQLRDGEADGLEGFVISSASEFVVELEHPLAFFPALVSHPVAAIVPEGTTQFTGTWRDGPAGTGPFRLVRLDPESGAELEANPDYWRKGFPKSRRLIFRFGVTPEATLEEFKEGKLSITSTLKPVAVKELRRDPEFAPGYLETPSLSTYFVAFNLQSEIFRDRDVRRAYYAALQAVELDEIFSAASVLATRAKGLIPPNLIDPRDHGRMPAATADVLERIAGKELTAALSPTFHSQYNAVWAALREAIHALGPKITKTFSTIAEMKAAVVENALDLTIMAWVADYPDADTFTDGLLSREDGFLGPLLGTDELERLIMRGRTETDPGIRRAAYQEIEELLFREAIVAPLFHNQIYSFARPEVRGPRLQLSAPYIRYDELYIES